ncbi:hypothetical protein N7509_004845 [Penicillium cosmopolitanum]|uniref:RING-type E3 ubiquitin transferase n=1 Tax=Penicillium cosmopolitanum TaxID=1131564 RepID=A0A9W9W196_9EURO|nr:uncharacterized protein N7509_004845 [Penicillium cosmopolitanum]KAJ5396732.1 hypothetical protein N7509_004845 [Penicillium cosmopolitanum]
MADEADVRHEVLQKTLREVADEGLTGETNDPCVICLDSITERTVAVPCNHSNFDYLCLLSWLEQQPSCPLCKVGLTAVKYELNAPRGPKIYNVPTRERPKANPETSSRSYTQRRALAGGLDIGDARSRRRGPRSRTYQRPPVSDDPLSARRNVYRNNLYSLRVGSNRLSQYSEVAPENFNRDEALLSRARKWIRRELQVFSFLTPGPEGEEQGRGPVPHAGHQRLEDRRANNAEFLLEYVIAILRTIDIKGSSGQAEELLRDFIGRDNARLFLHEMLAWLRSPYTSLEDWDRHVQYPTSTHTSRDRESQEIDSNYRGRRRPRNPPPARGRSASPIRGRDRSLFDRISRPDGSETSTSTQNEVQSRRRGRYPRPRNRELLD